MDDIHAQNSDVLARVLRAEYAYAPVCWSLDPQAYGDPSSLPLRPFLVSPFPLYSFPFIIFSRYQLNVRRLTWSMSPVYMRQGLQESQVASTRQSPVASIFIRHEKAHGNPIRILPGPNFVSPVLFSTAVRSLVCGQAFTHIVLEVR